MNWLILFTAVLFGTCNYVLLKKFNGRDIRGIGDTLLFNSMISLIWAVIFFIWNIAMAGSFVLPSVGAMLFGVFYGLNLCVYFLFKMQSLACGPISITTFVSACAFVIPTLFGLVFLDESMGIVKWLGVGLMVISLALSVNAKESGGSIKKQWILYVFLLFASGGMMGIINKLFNRSEAAGEVGSMMLCASIVSALTFAVFAFVLGGITKMGVPKIHKSAVLFILGCGIVSCLNQTLNIFLGGRFDAVILFPVSNGSMILVNTLVGVLFFGEKLSSRQIIGFVLGFVSIVMIGCF